MGRNNESSVEGKVQVDKSSKNERLNLLWEKSAKLRLVRIRISSYWELHLSWSVKTSIYRISNFCFLLFSFFTLREKTDYERINQPPGPLSRRRAKWCCSWFNRLVGHIGDLDRLFIEALFKAFLSCGCVCPFSGGHIHGGWKVTCVPYMFFFLFLFPFLFL